VDALRQEESLRVRNRVAAGLAEKQWAIPAELGAVCKEALPPGFGFDGGRVRRA
jgi:hypothetical protein